MHQRNEYTGSSALVAISVILFLPPFVKSLPQSYQQACQQYSAHPEFCINSLSTFGLEEMDVASGTGGRVVLATSAIQAALIGLNERMSKMFSPVKDGALNKPIVTSNNVPQPAANHDCIQLLRDASELIGTCLSNSLNSTQLDYSAVADIHTWMSAALTYYQTCMDGFKDATMSRFKEGDTVGMMLSNALAFVASMYPLHASSKGRAKVPHWVAEKHFLKPIKAAITGAKLTVAQDGSGQFSSISEAVAAAPSNSKSTYVIYIKQGTYKEKVIVPKDKINIMFVGDGMGKTVITGSTSVQDGVTTFNTATVVINGNGFLGRDLTIQNTAGPANHQAVALRVSADKVAFYRSSLEGYQDTLYAHTFRQFYRECTVYGTVDFIFGNAAAVFQSCTLLARLPLSQQKNTFTAQARTDPNQNTGFAFQDCTLDGTADLKASGVPSYLGRPWQLYSRTVFLGCYEGSVINPAGWLEWSGDFALKTLFFGEYLCTGPGAGAASRVSWSTQLYSAEVASQFTPGSFISGGQWLGGLNVPFKLGL